MITIFGEDLGRSSTVVILVIGSKLDLPQLWSITKNMYRCLNLVTSRTVGTNPILVQCRNLRVGKRSCYVVLYIGKTEFSLDMGLSISTSILKHGSHLVSGQVRTLMLIEQNISHYS